MVLDIPSRLDCGPVVLRPLDVQDAAPYARAFAEDPELGRLLGFEEDPTDEVVVQEVAGADQRAAEGKGFQLAVCGADDGSFIGSIMAFAFAWKDRRCEFGFWLVPSARGRGLAGAAVSRLLDWVVDELPIDRIEMTTTPDNAPTRALAERLGFIEEGMYRKRNVERGQRVDLVCFGVLASDWRKMSTVAGGR